MHHHCPYYSSLTDYFQELVLPVGLLRPNLMSPKFLLHNTEDFTLAYWIPGNLIQFFQNAKEIWLGASYNVGQVTANGMMVATQRWQNEWSWRLPLFIQVQTHCIMSCCSYSSYPSGCPCGYQCLPRLAMPRIVRKLVTSNVDSSGLTFAQPAVVVFHWRKRSCSEGSHKATF